MFARSAQYAAVLLLIAMVTPGVGRGDIVYQYDPDPGEQKFNWGELDGVGGGPVVFDDDSGPDRTMSVTTVTVGAVPATLDEDVDSLDFAKLGIGDDAEFDANEVWEFNWDVETTLTSISFQSEGTNFFVRNDAWQGRNFETDHEDFEGGRLEYESGDNRFRFFAQSGGTDDDTFDLTKVTGDSREVFGGTTYRFTADGPTTITAFTFATPTAIPEPGSAIALLGIAGLAVGRRFHRKRKQAVASGEE